MDERENLKSIDQTWNENGNVAPAEKMNMSYQSENQFDVLCENMFMCENEQRKINCKLKRKKRRNKKCKHDNKDNDDEMQMNSDTENPFDVLCENLSVSENEKRKVKCKKKHEIKTNEKIDSDDEQYDDLNMNEQNDTCENLSLTEGDKRKIKCKKKIKIKPNDTMDNDDQHDELMVHAMNERNVQREIEVQSDYFSNDDFDVIEKGTTQICLKVDNAVLSRVLGVILKCCNGKICIQLKTID
jgi:hypothetical protein